MKKLSLLILAGALATTGCQQQNAKPQNADQKADQQSAQSTKDQRTQTVTEGAVVGATLGAVTGALVDKDKRGRGALVGAAAGGLMGGLLGSHVQDKREEAISQEDTLDVMIAKSTAQREYALDTRNNLQKEIESIEKEIAQVKKTKVSNQNKKLVYAKQNERLQKVSAENAGQIEVLEDYHQHLVTKFDAMLAENPAPTPEKDALQKEIVALTDAIRSMRVQEEQLAAIQQNLI
ncbi:hypothetical protein HCH_02788 [Hahella chejuensis KCTC 2396]|uniref:Glycine zipper domain-containing protein n=1 Tax=Hahella chejuensis (strain KCTC 2396) TaxID=349521 RepID=Q2SIF6_HAHCH|nr:glycine zipper domain-containing protein [Hahella chejuensis]ABC29568.1 hypothetical protein HCH_02788 [Hahella chejuensis KCTC 2396]